MNLETLTAAVGPGGSLRPEKPCAQDDGDPDRVHPLGCLCHGTGKVHNLADPIFQALWEDCSGDEGQIYGHWVNGVFLHYDHCWGCHGSGYVRRSRAEADGWLMDALDKLGLEAEIQLHPSSCTVSVREEGRIYRSGKPLTDWLDALAAALLAWMDAQGVKA